MKLLDPRSKRERGRPRVYTKAQRRTIAKYLRANGLTHGVEKFNADHEMAISVPTAMSIAKEANPPVVFTRGRPVGV